MLANIGTIAVESLAYVGLRCLDKIRFNREYRRENKPAKVSRKNRK